MISPENPLRCDSPMSKSRYTQAWQCPKILWYEANHPEKKFFDDYTLDLMRMGQDVGELAKQRFEGYVDVSKDENGNRITDKAELVRRTVAAIADKNVTHIAEASFFHGHKFCSVDMLSRVDGGWIITEIKSSKEKSEDDRHPYGTDNMYLYDIAFQTALLQSCGLNIKGSRLGLLSKDYVYQGGELDLDQLFTFLDVTEEALELIPEVSETLEIADYVLSSDDEPHVRFSRSCNKPHACPYWKECSACVPARSPFDLYRMKMQDKANAYYDGYVTYEDLWANYKFKTGIQGTIQKRQVEHALFDLDDYIESENIASFVKSAKDKVAFLDFETIQTPIPIFANSRPYAQIPFQYSMHYYDENGKLQHREFLGDGRTDPRRALAEQLVIDFPDPENTTIFAYNMSFERSRLKELADLYPDLHDHLMKMHDSVMDLLVPFRSGWYYNRAMGGSFSIKSVLPALFPNDPDLDYKSLDQVHNGTEAMAKYKVLGTLEGKEYDELRENLLKYCCLDTLATVKVWERLKEVAS